MADVGHKFHNTMVAIIQESRQRYGWLLTRFAPMVEEYGGVGAAKRLLAKGPAYGQYEDPYRLGRLDLIMEYQVVQEEFRPLFNAEELETASWIMSEIQRGNVFPSTS